uniref:Uncharacterized protein n=1 Tax=Oryza brachyantha TaxID=4533 RepID=J3KX87_ORYBR
STSAETCSCPPIPPSGLSELPPMPSDAPSPPTSMDPDRRLLDLGGSFTSLLAPTPAPLPGGHFTTTGFLLGMAPPAPSPAPPAHPPPTHPHPPVSQAGPEGIWAMGWPHLSI